MTHPAFLHTSPVHVAVFDDLLAEHSPQTRAIHAVDETLLEDARRDGPEAVAERVSHALLELGERGATQICCTCSTIGAIAERTDIGIPVIRVDRPMATHAVELGPRIAVIAAVESTLEPTRALLEDAAVAAGRSATLELVTASTAWALFESGDHAGYLAQIAAAAMPLAHTNDVIVLAQASMAGAETLLAELKIPVLSSPRLAVEHLITRPP